MSESAPELPEGALAAILRKSSGVDPRDEQIAVLENQVQELKDRNYEERFLWTIAIMVIIDAYIFSHIENWAGAVVIGILELIAVIVLADRYKVNTVAPLIDKLTGAFGTLGRDKP